MKPSNFNIFFLHESNQIGYKSFSNEFIIIDPTLYEMYLVGEKSNSFSELNNLHPEFYSFLIEKGFLVDHNLDEFQHVKHLSQEIDNDDSQFELIVNPTMNCNFKCWYCYETHIKDSKMGEETISNVIKLADKVIQNQKGLKKFKLSFFGGEPLLYFEKVIKPIAKQIWELCQNNGIFLLGGMTTNGLLINQEMLDFCNEYGLIGFQITLDGNREQHNKVRFVSEERGSFDKIVQNIKLAAKNEMAINVRINCSAQTMPKVDEIMNEFKDLSEEELQFISFNFHKVWQEPEKIEEQISDSGFLFNKQGFNVGGISMGEMGRFTDSCYADKRYQATVNYNGEVFKCTARDFKNDSGEGILNDDGSIAWNERYEKRLNSKFKNAPCKECRILPLCAGGCSQQAIENEGVDYCILGFDETAKEQIVKNKFKALLVY